jgi:hypothetical protein
MQSMHAFPADGTGQRVGVDRAQRSSTGLDDGVVLSTLPWIRRSPAGTIATEEWEYSIDPLRPTTSRTRRVGRTRLTISPVAMTVVLI